VDRGLRTARLAVPLAAVLVAVTGCGNGGEKTSTGAVKPPPAKAVRAMQTRLEDAVLTSRAVGPGWTVAPPDQVAPVKQYCNRPLGKGLKPFAQTRVAFRQRFGSVVTQNLWAYAGDGAERVIDDFRSLTESCRSWKVSPEIGRTVTYTMGPLEVDELGDDTVAARLRSANAFGGIEVVHSFVAVMIQRGNVIDLVTQTANSGLFMSKAEAEKLARRADRRLAASR
jgi:hypothetical protein